MAIRTLGFGLFFTFDEDMSIVKIAVIEAVAGLGVGLNFQSHLITLQSHVDPSDFATAAATFGFTRNIATSLSVVIGGVVFQNSMQSHTVTLADILEKDPATKLNSASTETSVNLVASLPIDQHRAVRAAYVVSLRCGFYIHVLRLLVSYLAFC
jgi:hypothetical protein